MRQSIPLLVLSARRTQCRQRDDSVPESGRYRSELSARHLFLRVVHDRSEYDDRHSQREHQESQLGRAGFQCVPKDSQALRVSGEFEDSEHSLKGIGL